MRYATWDTARGLCSGVSLVCLCVGCFGVGTGVHDFGAGKDISCCRESNKEILRLTDGYNCTFKGSLYNCGRVVIPHARICRSRKHRHCGVSRDSFEENCS